MEQQSKIQYHWKNEDTFEINGQTLQMLISTFRAVVGTPEAQKIIASKIALDQLESVVQQGIMKGTVKVSKDGKFEDEKEKEVKSELKASPKKSSPKAVRN